MASVLEELQLMYKGTTYEHEGSTIRTTFVYQGSKELCLQAANSDLQVGMDSQEFGTITSTKITQDEGPFWHIEVIYEINIIGGSSGEGSQSGPGHSELTARVISNPLENHPKYKRKWNYNLYCIGPYPGDGVVNDIWNNTTAVTPYDYIWSYNSGYTLLQFGQFRPAKPDILPFVNRYDDPYAMWYAVKAMTKPGTSCYMLPTYEMTEYGQHKNKSEAGWAVSNRIGKTVKPKKGDFGIDNKLEGNWLCEGGSISHNGKFWVSELTYLFSGNGRNWDEDLYD